MMKRNFSKNVYTVVEKYNDNYTYYRGIGNIQPSPSVASIQSTETQFNLNHEIKIITRQDYPKLDVNASGDEYGDTFQPSYVMWTGVPYTCYGQNIWTQQDDTYRNLLASYDSSNEILQYVRDLDWSEISNFQEAINGVEIVNELKLSNVIE